MSLRGRPPSPFTLLRGGRRGGGNILRPTPGATCPRELPGAAKREWARLAPELERLGLLTVVDRAALAAYVEAVATFEWAVRKIRREGYITEAGNGTPIPHPAVAIMQTATRQMRELSAEFGFTPAARNRIIAVPAPGGGDDNDRFFGPRPIGPGAKGA